MNRWSDFAKDRVLRLSEGDVVDLRDDEEAEEPEEDSNFASGVRLDVNIPGHLIDPKD